MSDESKVVVDEKMEQFISYIEGLTVLEVSKLVKALKSVLSAAARSRLLLPARCCRCRPG